MSVSLIIETNTIKNKNTHLYLHKTRTSFVCPPLFIFIDTLCDLSEHSVGFPHVHNNKVTNTDRPLKYIDAF